MTALDPTLHGDLAASRLLELGLDPKQVLNFAVNINPWGHGPAVGRALAVTDPHAYPEPYSETLTRALADYAAVSADSVLVGNGATDLIWSWLRTFGKPGDRLHVLEPTFSEARNAAGRLDLQVTETWASATLGFVWDWAQVSREVQERRPKFLYLGHPNNPTGVASDRNAILQLARENPDTLVLLDESFLSLSHLHEELQVPRSAPNLLRLRSLTKDHGLAGVRLGYLLGSAEHVRRLRKQQAPWAVNAYAQNAGLATLSDQDHVTSSRAFLLELLPQLCAGLHELGYECIPSTTLFAVAHVKRAKQVTEACLARGILVRDCSSFGLPEYIRVCARPKADQERLLQVLSEL